MSNRGILYIATTDTFIKEAQKAAIRADRVTDLPISIVAHREIKHDVFDEVIIDKNPTYTMADKARNLLKSPYDETIYMDSDTYVVEDIDELFDVLKNSELAVTLDPFEGSLCEREDEEIPTAFPEFQAGVIVYRHEPNVKKLIKTWQDNHSPNDSPDQLSFRYTIYEEEFDVGLFPARYNALTGTTINGPVKVLHCNNRSFSDLDQGYINEILSVINENKGIRLLFLLHSHSFPRNIYMKPIPLTAAYMLIEKRYSSLLKSIYRNLPF